MGDEKKEEVIQIRIDYDTSASETPARYTTELIIHHTEREFTLAFFEIPIPLLLGTSEEKVQRLQEIPSLRAQCVARLIVPPDKMAEFVRVFQDSYQKFLASKKTDQEDQNGNS